MWYKLVMSQQSIQEKYKLPASLKVVVKKDSLGGFTIKLPDYPGCITYAENIGEFIGVLNDMTLTYFNVPRKVAQKVDFLYVPRTKKIVVKEKKVKKDRLSSREFIPFTPYYA